MLFHVLTARFVKPLGDEIDQDPFDGAFGTIVHSGGLWHKRTAVQSSWIRSEGF
jgi:hypothetical protein